MFDLHLYQCFSKTSTSFSIQKHLDTALHRNDRLKKLSQYVDVIVGEWSLKLNHNDEINNENYIDVITKYSTAQITGMKDCDGYIFWSYKVSESELPWNFRRLVEKKIINIEDYIE